MIRNITTLLIVLLMAGCGGGGVSAVQYYLVDPIAKPALRDADELHVQIIDLQLPQYLERFQIASRETGNRLVFADGHQWGENLRKNLIRTLSINLTSLLATNNIGTPIDRTTGLPDYRIQVFIQKFERDPNDVLQLSARWQITSADNEHLGIHSLVLSSERPISRFDDTVSSMASLFADLSTAIAKSITDLEQPQ